MAVQEYELSSTGRAPIELHKYRLSTAQYYEMGKAGIFGDDKRIELIDGELVKLEPIGPMHSRRGRRLFLALLNCLRAEDFFVIYEEPITVVDGTEPQPDLAVARGPEASYDDRHPIAEELVLVVEVQGSTLASDRKRKLPLYAAAGIPEFWIVNLADKQVEVYRTPKGSTYAEMTVQRSGDTLSLSFAQGTSVDVAEFLP